MLQKVSNDFALVIIFTEAVFRDEKSSDHAADDEQILDAPEPVLNAGPEVVGGLDVDHDDGHQHEEQSHNKAEPGIKARRFRSGAPK